MINIKEYLTDTFTSLIAIDTQSDYESKEFPSTEAQSVFAEVLAGRLSEIGVPDIRVDKYSYVYASLPANTENMPSIGFISHMDTSPDCSGYGIKPNIIEDYDGKDIKLKGITLSPTEFPSLLNYIGKTLITTDGTTLLGADDKAGISEILTAVKYLVDHPDIKHGKVAVCFTPDEEIGSGADHFDVTAFGCDFAYTVDGGIVGEISYENFNAARAKIDITGKSVHPGDAKGVMINAALAAAELNEKLPKDETPAKTDGYEGFYHLTEISGNVEKAHLDYIIRDFDKDNFEKRKIQAEIAVMLINAEYGSEIAKIDIYDEYYNMSEVINADSEPVQRAVAAIKKAGIEPIIKPIRGGTDGARITFMGLPCPNIFTGGHNFHGPYEYICVESMVAAVETILNIVTE
jgi:tripeptide aminopeptidase